MTENKRFWICGLCPQDSRYVINGVTYTVSSHFEPFKSENTLRSRMREAVTSNMTDLTVKKPESTISPERVYSAVGKED